MKILHTADWHLGHKLYQKERDDEFEFVLHWLIDCIREQQIDMLIVAGDIFDTDMPPNSARRLYYDFLCRLSETDCRDVVIVAGNHDSPHTLEASKELLRRFNIHVVGQIPENRSEQIIEICDKTTGELTAVVAAVPFLRDRDLRTSQAGQTTEERRQQMRLGVQRHYEELRQEILPYMQRNVPLIATGHLFVSGGDRDGRLNTIHIGTLDVIEASQFPLEFDYIALGHLHRPQRMRGFEHICYSGTLIPLDFNEINYSQIVKVLDFEGKKLRRSQNIEVPQYRKIRHYKYELEQMKEKLASLEPDRPTWLKLEVPTLSFYSNLFDEEIAPLLKDKNVEVLSCTQPLLSDNSENIDAEHLLPNLSELSAAQVFKMKMDAAGITDAQHRQDLEDTFTELLSQ